MLTSEELASIRTDALLALPDACKVQRRELESDGAGGFSESWESVATVACRVSPVGQSPQERVIAEQITSVSSWTVTVPAETDVRAADRLVVGSRIFEVVAVLARSYEVARRVVCTEVV